MNPKISVVVPVYNTAVYLRKCLDSICAQTFTDFEVLLIDDGSTDESPSICDEYSAKDPRFRVFHTKNHGVASARQFALEHLRGEYMASVDSDDWVEDNMLEAMYSKAITEDADIVVCGMNLVKGGCCYQVDLKIKSYDIQTIRRNCFDDWTFHSIWNKLIRVSTINRYSVRFNLSVSIYEDMIFIVELYSNNVKTEYIAQPLYNYQYRQGSLTQCELRKFIFKLRDVFNVVREKYDVEYSRSFLSRLIFSFYGINDLSSAQISNLLKDDKIVRSIGYADHPKLRLNLLKVARFRIMYYPAFWVYKSVCWVKSLIKGVRKLISKCEEDVI